MNREADCTAFLRWALPRLELRWPGFRKVRHQVCKRVRLRMSHLGMADFAAYRSRLETDPSEWRSLDACCHITISRFYRDRGVFNALSSRVLPLIASRGKREGRAARIWSAGCASGEEPYTVRILWDLALAELPATPVSILATDVDEAMLARAQTGCFKATSLHELTPDLVAKAFDRTGPLFCVKPQYRQGIEFRREDLRVIMPTSGFDLILCRYVAFTYFAAPVQQQILAQLTERLLPRGHLVIGTHEGLPETAELVPLPDAPQIFEKKP